MWISTAHAPGKPSPRVVPAGKFHARKPSCGFPRARMKGHSNNKQHLRAGQPQRTSFYCEKAVITPEKAFADVRLSLFSSPTVYCTALRPNAQSCVSFCKFMRSFAVLQCVWQNTWVFLRLFVQLHPEQETLLSSINERGEQPIMLSTKANCWKSEFLHAQKSARWWETAEKWFSAILSRGLIIFAKYPAACEMRIWQHLKIHLIS